MILYNSHVSGSLEVDENVFITGILYASEKHFYINHPTEEGKKLVYGTLEGPENAVYLRGRLNGDNVIELPDYWTKLVDEKSITVFFTPIGRGQILSVDYIKDNKIFIKKSLLTPFGKIYCNYLIFGERKDIPKLKTKIDPKGGVDGR